MRRILEMKFDSTVNLGHVLTILVLFFSAASVYVTTMVRLNEHELRIERVEAMHAEILRNTAQLIKIQESLAVIKYRLGVSDDNGTNGLRKP